MANNPLVSILMPVYNCQDYVGKAIQSIIDQSYSNWELLICDDASNDQSINAIEKWKDPRISFAHNSKNLGYLKSINKLFALAKGDFITFQDADDWSDEKRIEKQIAVFEQNAHLGICGTNGIITNDSAKAIGSQEKPELDAGIKEKMLRNNPFIGASIMIPKKVYEEFGPYREFFDRIGNEDYDWSSLICERMPAYNIQEPLYFYRQHDNSVSRDINLDRFLSQKYVLFLAEQRAKNNGLDGLSSPELKQDFHSHIEELKSPYLKDSSLIYRDYAGLFMYGKSNKKAIKLAYIAISKKPLKFINWRTLLYCIRKSIFKR